MIPFYKLWCSHVTFLSLNKKVTKEVSQRGATKKYMLWYDCHWQS